MNNLQLVQKAGLDENVQARNRLRALPNEIHVRTSDVQKYYRCGENHVWALRGVSIELAYGEFVALCGSSGSGKTTLLNLLGCLDKPSAGGIHIGGRNVSQMTDRELADFRATRLGFVFQTFNLIPVLSAYENVEYPLLKNRSLSRRERNERVLDALARVGLERFVSHRPGELSGGQRQRVAIARAFVHKPQLIIADEPTANLDRKTAIGILDLMAEMNLSMGLTVVVATHDPLVVERTDRAIQIADGRLVI